MRSSSNSRRRPGGFALVAIVAAVLGMALPLAPAAAQGGQVKVAVIDVQSILAESKRGTAVQRELEAFQKQKSDEIQSRGEELANLRKDYAEKGLSMAEDRLAQMKTEIEDKTVQFNRLRDDANFELKKRSEELLAQVEAQVMPIINQVGREGGYTLIFNKFQSGLVFADDAIDITGLVIERYDAGYQADGE
mgnify:CR=1 FL=1